MFNFSLGCVYKVEGKPELCSNHLLIKSVVKLSKLFNNKSDVSSSIAA